jgi:uncharacterized protein
MKQIIEFKNAKDFLAATGQLLEQDEVSNNIILGVANCLLDDPLKFGNPPFYAAVQDNNSAELVALMTPPFKLVLYAAQSCSNESFGALARHIKTRIPSIPGVIGVTGTAAKFKNEWCAITPHEATMAMGMRVYRLTTVRMPSEAPGLFRQADVNDLPIVNLLLESFYREVFKTDDKKIMENAAGLIGNGDLFVWDNNGPVSLASKSRQTRHGQVVGHVYTPPHVRGKGYATACVASLCRHILDSGKTFCSLFTDLANPTSNSIYQKVGFEPVCDFYDYSFQ